MNGELFLFSQTLRWVQAGGTFRYDATFATDPNVGGYPSGAVLLRADGQGFWLNTRDENPTDPDATGIASGWVSLNADWSAASGLGAILNRPDLATVATSGKYEDLIDLPTIPAAQVNADWNATAGVAKILNKPVIPSAYALPPATATTLGGLIAGPGTTIKADGTLSTAGTVIVNLTSGANVALDLTPIVGGAPEILFNLPITAGVTTTLTISNPPVSGMLAEFTLQVRSGAGSVLTFPTTVRWSQGIAPLVTGAAGRVDTFVFFTQDGGASYFGYVAARNQ
ncbi:hypothetical protein AWB71_04309 [Caballeronia peredens]|nr:hypothetical protein AWB71_04309 [Caballeronia peredens]